MDQDQAGRGDGTDSGGNNDMKGPNRRSHNALAHLRRRKKIKYPDLFTHVHTHTKQTCRHIAPVEAHALYRETKTNTHKQTQLESVSTARGFVYMLRFVT